MDTWDTREYNRCEQMLNIFDNTHEGYKIQAKVIKRRISGSATQNKHKRQTLGSTKTTEYSLGSEFANLQVYARLLIRE